MAGETSITAAVLVIGDEILSGRTKDKNIGYIADYLGQIGIDLREVRIVPDIEDDIVAALNALRHRYSYVFTTGGIGPTHDDITADAVAKAFGVPISEDPRAITLLLERIKPEDLNAARRRMARIPEGGDLVENKISKAPGFIIGNVIVMAGVPAIMQAMLDGVAPRLKTGAKVLVETVEAGNLPEGLYAADLGDIAERHKGVSIGSYPSFADGRFRNSIVLRSKDEAALAAAIAETRALIDRLARERKSA
jgi:molybdenum cofactor synthesis domain-containing protein